MIDGNHEGTGAEMLPHLALSGEAEITPQADGSVKVSQLGTAHDMTPGEIRDTAADFYGIEPDAVRVTMLNTPHAPEESQRARRRGSVAFSSGDWHSPWNPGGDDSDKE